MQKSYFVYILTNHTNKVLYTGVTNSLLKRLIQHHQPHPSSFTYRYKTFKLVYFESYVNIIESISREKYIKGKNRSWKIDLITKNNPVWKNFAIDFIDSQKDASCHINGHNMTSLDSKNTISLISHSE